MSGWLIIKLLILAESSSGGLNSSRVSASVGGEMRLLMVGIAGAVAITKPAEVKIIDIAQNERKRRSLDFDGACESSGTM